MPCHPYNAIRRADSPRTVSARGFAGVMSLMLALLASVTIPRSADAQWWCAPLVASPCCDRPVVCCPAPYVVRRPIAQWEPGPTGPLLPPLILPESQPAVTNYPPADGLLSSANTTAAALDDVAGELRIAVTEAFLNRLLTRTDTNAGPVQDVILGAYVTGEQSTESRVSVDVQPSEGTARLFLQLAGTTVNQTIGVTPQAAVRSRGTHDFRLTKQVDFDGLQFTTRSPSAWVTPRLTTEGAVTPISGMPLIGPLATRIALTEVERRRPATEQVVSQRVTGQVAPRFNREVDQLLGQANDRLRSAVPRLLDFAGLAPSDQMLASTDDRVLFGIGLPEFGRRSAVHRPARSRTPTNQVSLRPTAGNIGWVPIRQITQRVSIDSRPFLPPPSVPGGRALTIAVHEEFVNHLLRRASLEGRQLPDRTIDRLLDLLGDVLSGTPISDTLSDGLGQEDPEFATILLADDQPLSLRFENGQAIVTALAGFRPLLTPEVPTQHIEIPFSLTAEEGRLTLVPGDVTVRPLAPENSGPMAELAGPVIRQQVESRLQSVPLPRSVPLQLTGLPEATLSIRDVTLTDGWLVIALD